MIRLIFIFITIRDFVWTQENLYEDKIWVIDRKLQANKSVFAQESSINASQRPRKVKDLANLMKISQFYAGMKEIFLAFAFIVLIREYQRASS